MATREVGRVSTDTGAILLIDPELWLWGEAERANDLAHRMGLHAAAGTPITADDQPPTGRHDFVQQPLREQPLMPLRHIQQFRPHEVEPEWRLPRERIPQED